MGMVGTLKHARGLAASVSKLEGCKRGAATASGVSGAACLDTSFFVATKRSPFPAPIPAFAPLALGQRRVRCSGRGVSRPNLGLRSGLGDSVIGSLLQTFQVGRENATLRAHSSIAP